MLELNEIISFMKASLASEVNMSASHIDIHKDFFEYGLDSINAIYFLELIEREFKLQLSPLYFWDYPTIHSLAVQIQLEIDR